MYVMVSVKTIFKFSRQIYYKYGCNLCEKDVIILVCVQMTPSPPEQWYLAFNDKPCLLIKVLGNVLKLKVFVSFFYTTIK